MSVPLTPHSTLNLTPSAVPPLLSLAVHIVRTPKAGHSFKHYRSIRPVGPVSPFRPLSLNSKHSTLNIIEPLCLLI